MPICVFQTNHDLISNQSTHSFVFCCDMLLVVKCHHQHSNCLFYAWKKHAHTHTHTPSMVLFSHPPPNVLKLGKKTLKKPRISSRWRNGTVLERPLQWKSQISKRRYSRGKALASASIWVMKSSNGWKLLPPHDDYSWSCERYGSGVSDFMGGHYCSWQFLMGWLMILFSMFGMFKKLFHRTTRENGW